MTAKGEAAPVRRLKHARAPEGAGAGAHSGFFFAQILIAPSRFAAAPQNCAASSAMTGSAPLSMRARCVAVIGNWRCM